MGNSGSAIQSVTIQTSANSDDNYEVHTRVHMTVVHLIYGPLLCHCNPHKGNIQINKSCTIATEIQKVLPEDDRLCTLFHVVRNR